MNDTKTIIKAVTAQEVLGQIFGVQPEQDVHEDHIRLYWSEEDLPIARKTAQKFLNGNSKGDLRIDIAPVITGAVMDQFSGFIIAGAFTIGTLFLLERLK